MPSPSPAVAWSQGLGSSLPASKSGGPPPRFRPPHKSIGEAKRNYGIEILAGGVLACELCEQLGTHPYAGFFQLEGGERMPLCEVCLIDLCPELGILLAASAFLRKVGAIPSPEARSTMAAEIAHFAQVFDRLLTRRFGPAADASRLLAHFAKLGRAERVQPPRTC